ncbi:hypothetical protein P170DRAFT_477396 [Aspergillus steynii IBT 23096]|uniref:Uncharacterized protein n=1 Tax=Aspergillus steynii IBT 23096 TaxID=1392250 RepID=A0A2I2G0Z9_9EURO|nr:uncharacterized protein P170DRAFT_477396 [Aspergillus steynii IBT 23096]PLB46516.1 hypothetical protein P170DRAFT_477396 [Aspergillus steynii IBT 23096]
MRFFNGSILALLAMYVGATQANDVTSTVTGITAQTLDDLVLKSKHGAQTLKALCRLITNWDPYTRNMLRK